MAIQHTALSFAFEMVSLPCSPGWVGIHYVAQDGLNRTELLLPEPLSVWVAGVNDLAKDAHSFLSHFTV